MKLVLCTLALSLTSFAHATITPQDPLPTKILACGGSLIRSIGGRLEGDTDFSSGTGVEFSNGGYNVSYEKIVPIVNSKIGDHVMMCLVYIPNPKNCPPGGERGRVYTVTNLRTLESWTLPDSQHMCGGA